MTRCCRSSNWSKTNVPYLFHSLELPIFLDGENVISFEKSVWRKSATHGGFESNSRFQAAKHGKGDSIRKGAAQILAKNTDCKRARGSHGMNMPGSVICPDTTAGSGAALHGHSHSHSLSALCQDPLLIPWNLLPLRATIAQTG